MNGSDAERSKREIPTQVDDPELTGTVPEVGSEPTVDGTETLTYSLGSAIDEVQRFRLLRPHAQGGLGAVFVALDTELNREVALKQILDRHADDQTSRSRFLLEAEITGGLEHPGIVPVYGMGVYENGRPYYAMRFIRGDSLKEAIGLFHVRSIAPAATRSRQISGNRPRRDRSARTTPRDRATWSFASCSAGSSTFAMRSTTPIREACSIETSSRATSSSASMERHWSSTGGWPRRPARAMHRRESGR